MSRLPTVIEYLEQKFTTREKTNDMVKDMELIWQDAEKLVRQDKLSSSDVFKTKEAMMRLYSNELDNATSHKSGDISKIDRRNALKQRLYSRIKSVARK